MYQPIATLLLFYFTLNSPKKYTAKSLLINHREATLLEKRKAFRYAYIGCLVRYLHLFQYFTLNPKLMVSKELLLYYCSLYLKINQSFYTQHLFI